MNEVLVDELIHEHFAHAFDIHGAARGEVADGPFQLGWTGDVFTAPRDELGIARNRSTAGGTLAVDVLEEIERLRVLGPLLLHEADDGGDDFARLLNYDDVADADVFALDLFLVVE